MLIVIESPKKSKKIAEYSGEKVLATVGHFQDLPEDAIGINPQTLDPDFRLSGDRGKEVAAKIKAAADGQDVVIATDPDREGYAIGRHVYDLVKGKARSIRRAEIREVTKPAVAAAISAAVDFSKTNAGLYDAFLGRRVGDRVAGYALSPAASKALSGPFSVGRVQSPAAALAVQLERKIRAFQPEPFWDVTAELSTSEGAFKANHAQNPFKEQAQCQTLLAKLEGIKTALVTKVDRKTSTQPPKPPFSTVDMQASASVVLKMPPETTQKLAQDLFAAGLCTYIRTDSYTLSDEWSAPAQEKIREMLSPDHAPAAPVKHKSKNSQAEAHEAIRPSGIYGVEEIPALVEKESLTSDHARLLELIWRRAMASQMSPAVWDSTTVTLDVAGETFTASGRALSSPGYRTIWIHTEKKNELLPTGITEGQTLTVNQIQAEEKKTKAPGRYSEASLLKKLEELGVGRPSTYATIIQSIKARGYVEVKGGYLHATAKGETLVSWLEQHYPWIADCGFTAQMEERLDKVEAGSEQWKAFVAELIERCGGLPTSQQKSASAPATLSDKQRGVIERNGDEKIKKKMEAGDVQACKKWLDDYFKKLDADKKKSAAGKKKK